MKKIKDNKAITLIALIITIVVLLILAVVAIGTAQESNIVGYAQNASGKYEESKDNEISLLKQYENKIEEVISGADEYPKVYSIESDDGTIEYWIQTGDSSGVVVLKHNYLGEIYLKTIISDCNDLKNISNYSNAEIIDNGYKYSKVAHNSKNFDILYCPNIDKWINFYKLIDGSDGTTVLKAEIKSEWIMEEDTSLTQEQINAYIAAAVD